MIRLTTLVLALILVGCAPKSQEQYALEYASLFYPTIGEPMDSEKIIAASQAVGLDSKKKEEFTRLCQTLGKVTSINQIKGGVIQYDKDKFLGKYHATADFSGDKRLIVVMVTGKGMDWKLTDFHTNMYEAEPE